MPTTCPEGLFGVGESESEEYDGCPVFSIHTNDYSLPVCYVSCTYVLVTFKTTMDGISILQAREWSRASSGHFPVSEGQGQRLRAGFFNF